MGWSEHSAGLWRLSIFSRSCADRMDARTSPALGRETPQALSQVIPQREDGWPFHYPDPQILPLFWRLCYHRQHRI